MSAKKAGKIKASTDADGRSQSIVCSAQDFKSAQYVLSTTSNHKLKSADVGVMEARATRVAYSAHMARGEVWKTIRTAGWQTRSDENSSESHANASAPGAIQNIVSGARDAQMGGGAT